ncbi:MAG TPA: ATP-binding cassette domain-containing protein [Blastocatellia bacterium]|nr:ATP-binding cassette domain-containing protein [Blastocatellia bacterium]
MSIVLEQVTKRYGSQWVVDNVALEVADKELFVLLGSSGSGKSTILRMIAGLTEPTSGRILLHGRDVTYLTPQKRGTGFVFQNYSIFRHMTVAENIEFGLKIRKTPKAERARRRDELLELVGLAGLGSRYAHQLSGGQQQRVALARALCYEPSVLLLDEPFGALDVKIRAQLRRSLKEIQRRLGVATILVTHDQEEAFELADRIGVLEHGRLLEVGDGEQLYAKPRSLFAATFLGAGTVLVGRAEAGRARFGSLLLPIPEDKPHEDGARAQLLFRPEQVALTTDGPAADLPLLGRGEIIEQNFIGALRRLRLRLPRLEATRQLAPALPFGEEGMLIDAALPAEVELEGEAIWVALRGWTILNQPEPRLLVYDLGQGATAPLQLTRLLADKLQAAATVLTAAENPEHGEGLRAALGNRQQEVGLDAATLQIRYGNAAEQIAAAHAEAIYEMLVMSPQPRAASLRARATHLPLREGRAVRHLGEALATALEHTDVPVLVVKGERAKLERTLICTAAGEPGKSDIKTGGRLARRLGTKTALLFVTKEPDNLNALTRRHLDQGAATLRAMDVDCEVRVRQAASPVEGILAEAAAGDYDLIVIGFHGPRSHAFYKFNDIMLRVLEQADRPVLVVPTDRM